LSNKQVKKKRRDVFAVCCGEINLLTCWFRLKSYKNLFHAYLFQGEEQAKGQQRYS
jgi:hypothetical protein